MIARLSFIAAVAAALLPTPAYSELSAPMKTCAGETDVDREVQIKACTAIIDSRTTSPADRAIAFNHRGTAWLVQGNVIVLGNPRREFERAIADFTAAIKINPKFRDAYLNRGYAWYSARDWARAIADYTAAIKIDPDFARSYALRLELYRANGERLLAIADVTELIRLDPDDVELYADRGLLWNEHGDHERAIADYMHAIKLDPKNDSSYARLGRLLMARGEYDRAIAVYSDAIAINPDAADRLADRGYIHFLRGDYPAAAADLHRAIEIFPVSLSNEILAPFRYIARTRAGQDASSELAAMIERRAEILKGTTVRPLHPALDLYLGRSSPEAALKAAGNSLRNLCETDFFVGEWHLMRGNRDEARKRLQAAAHERCDGVYRTYLAAVIELKRMGP